MTRIAVLDYGIGNLRSAQKGLERVGADARLTDDAGWIREAAGVVLPGVGAFGPCMEALRGAGLDAVAHEAIERGTPFLGICVGMQMLFAGSDESPGVTGLGVLPGRCRLLPAGVKRPQMQWNLVDRVRPSGLLHGLDDPIWAYFVHSYAAETDPEVVVATCDYGAPLVAVIERENVWATQFHPEKSASTGLRALAAFVARAAGRVAA